MPSLLIVDDVPDVHEMLIALIGQSGFLCAGASTGEEALMRCRQSHFDIALVDYAMEPMNGLELARRLQAEKPGIVLILMSGFAGEELAADAREHGVFLVIEKPIQVDALMLAVEKAHEEANSRASGQGQSKRSALPRLAEHLKEAEEHYIRFVLERCHGDRNEAARILDVSPDRLA